MLSAASASARGFRSPRFPSGRRGRPGVGLGGCGAPEAVISQRRLGPGGRGPVGEPGPGTWPIHRELVVVSLWVTFLRCTPWKLLVGEVLCRAESPSASPAPTDGQRSGQANARVDTDRTVAREHCQYEASEAMFYSVKLKGKPPLPRKKVYFLLKTRSIHRTFLFTWTQRKNVF